jgi:hypothetical protein
MSVLAIGGELFTEFFASMGFLTHTYRGDCKEALKCVEQAASRIKIFILSEKIDEHCLAAIKKFLGERNLAYVIIPEVDELDESRIHDYYDRILRPLLGI